MRKTLRSRRAVSPVIAALLLIAISVAAAVITYSWVMTMIDSQGDQAQTAIRIETVEIDYVSGGSQLKIILRNTGGVTAMIETLYIYDGDTRMVKHDDINYALGAGTVQEIGFTKHTDSWSTINIAGPDDKTVVSVAFVGSFELSHAYTIKIVTDNGFTMEGTYYSPGTW